MKSSQPDNQSQDNRPFEFIGYDFDENLLRAQFHYRGGTAENALDFVETVNFSKRVPIALNLNDKTRSVLDHALFLVFIVVGTSYYKAFPSKTVKLSEHISDWRAQFFNTIYQDGLSQYAYENQLERKDLAHFNSLPNTHDSMPEVMTENQTPLVLQSGGKDSLLTAELLNESGKKWTALYISSTDNYPNILDRLNASNVQIIKREIDRPALEKAKSLGGKNGHVPVTYINIAVALVQAIINGQTEIITSIGHEGAENHTIIKSTDSAEKDLPVNHQWSKTEEAEHYLQQYISDFISPSISVHSLIRKYSELKIAQLFVAKCWDKYGHRFSSCNRANYGQGVDNQTLTWCGECAKCANSYLLFAPFLEPLELNSLFKDQKSLFEKPELETDFKGLLGIDGVIKPFECIGEVDELRKAYHLKNPGYPNLPFDVPNSDFDLEKLY